MTKKELLRDLENYPDDADISVWWYCDRCKMNVSDGVIDTCPNGPSIQFNTESILDDPQAREIYGIDDNEEGCSCCPHCCRDEAMKDKKNNLN